MFPNEFNGFIEKYAFMMDDHPVIGGLLAGTGKIWFRKLKPGERQISPKFDQECPLGVKLLAQGLRNWQPDSDRIVEI